MATPAPAPAEGDVVCGQTAARCICGRAPHAPGTTHVCSNTEVCGGQWIKIGDDDTTFRPVVYPGIGLVVDEDAAVLS